MSEQQNNQGQKYQVLQSINENDSSFKGEQYNLISNKSVNNSDMDDQANLKESNLEDEVSSISQIQKKDHKLIKNNNSKNDEEQDTIEVVKDFVKNFVNLCKWKQENQSFRQLSTQIVFDGLFMTYLVRQSWNLKNQSQELNQLSRYLMQDLRYLEEDGASIYNLKDSHEHKTVYGKINNPIALSHIQKKMNDKNYNQVLNNQFELICNKQTINCTFQDDLNIINIASANQYQKNMTLIKSISASLVSIFSGSLFKSEIKFDSINPQIDYYFAGYKIISSNSENFQIDTICQSYNIQQLRYDQVAYLISILIASGLSVYFATKFIKNLFYLSKKISQNKEKKCKLTI